MLFSKSKIELIKKIDKENSPINSESALIFVSNGKNSLKLKYGQYIDQSKYNIDYNTMLTLNDVPLVHVQLNGCPTCQSLLATGYGIPENCKEIKKVREDINSNYVNIIDAIEKITPLINLLSDGIYMIANIDYYPTDGEGRFFWNIPNNLTEYEATGVEWTEDFELYDIFPKFLYPSQPNSKFDEKRVIHYIDEYNNGKTPIAIAYHLHNYMSILLDGHHKASAACLCKKRIKCITIIPTESYINDVKHNLRKFLIGGCLFEETMFTKEQIQTELNSQKFNKTKENLCYEYKNIINKKWEDEYIQSAKYYPTVKEVAQMYPLDILDISNNTIDSYLHDNNDESRIKIKTIISYLSRCDDKRVKHIAIKCARNCNQDKELQVVVFKALCKIKNDEDVENLFVDFLIDCEDKHDPVKKIADSYWS